MKVVRAVAGSIGCMVLLGCADVGSGGGIAITEPDSRASFDIEADQAYSISDAYREQDPLGPFGVDYLEFLNNPELITDDQFLAHSDPALSDQQLSWIESDAATVEDYAAGCVDGSGLGPTHIMAADCERMYGTCVSRVRRIPERRARALGYAACMGAYAVCRAAEEIGDMQ
jgi:hypothetical protein